MKVKQFIKQETVLSVAIVLAAISAVFVPPDAGYISYIDLRTLAILFSLMTVMAGLRRQGVFDRLGRALLGQTNSTLQLVLVLVGLVAAFAELLFAPQPASAPAQSAAANRALSCFFMVLHLL